MGKNRPHDLIYYKGGFIIMVFIIRVRILYHMAHNGYELAYVVCSDDNDHNTANDE